MTMRVFLAGATGVLGHHIVPRLLAAGHQVTALTRGRRPVPDGAAAVRGDVRDAHGLALAVREAAPDVIMHQLTDLSGGDPAANAELRKAGTRAMVDAALAAGVRRIVAQSIAWMYEPGDVPAVERTPLDVDAEGLRRVSVDGVVALEDTVRELPEWVVLRYGLLYGPGTFYEPGGPMAGQARQGALVAGRDVSSFVETGDAATAAVQALGWPTGAVNICDDEPAPAADWVPAFCRAVGAPPPPRSDAPRSPQARGADNHHARNHLGWEPAYPSWRDGFAEVISRTG
ncbi:NAD-dependent epimerase/dehydratase family protein [Nonomuraea sp. KM88]|uniref:NAD-dependent epimerase/dehydratase family protein n=1 Tax=Nonomuraea sp. KM88 TaxID=3457427 RepID=UPI003FCE08CB